MAMAAALGGSLTISRPHIAIGSVSDKCNPTFPSLFSRRRMQCVRAMSASGNLKHQQALRASQQPAAAASKDPLRSFPWDIAAKRFAARLSDLVWTCLKWLTIPTLLISSASELSYTLVHNKALFVPFSMLLGIVLAGVMKETALELSPNLQKGFPWHLVVIGLIFALVKLPGPSYPHWGRIILPHFANGGLWQTCYLVWQQRSSF